MDILYSTSVEMVGGRTGSAQSSDGLLDLTLATVMSAPSNDVKKSGDGYLMLAHDKFAADFAADVPPALSEFMARSQMPVAEAAFAGAIAPDRFLPPAVHEQRSKEPSLPPNGH